MVHWVKFGFSGYTNAYIRLHMIRVDYIRLHMVTVGYIRLQ